MELLISTLGCVFTLVELWTYPFSLVATIVAYVCIFRCGTMTRCLRVLLCMMLLRSPINAIRRTIVLIERALFVGEDVLLPYQELNNAVLYFTWYLICFSMILLCLERLMATFYRTATTELINHRVTCTLMVLILIPASFLAGLADRVVPTRYIQIGAFLVTTPILFKLYRTNRMWRRTKLGKSLAAKCAFEENIDGILCVLPLLCHINLCSLVTLILVEYQSLTSQYELGYDMGIINNVYGLLIAYESFFSPLCILHNFYRLSRRGRLLRRQCATRDTDADRIAHFDSLRNHWEMAERRTRSAPAIFTVETTQL